MATEAADGTDRRRSKLPFLLVVGACAALVAGLIVVSVVRDDAAPEVEKPTMEADPAGIWISPAEIAGLPTAGPAWESLVEYAQDDWGDPDISDQNSDHDVHTLAGALYASRLGDAAMEQRVIDALAQVEGTYSDEILALSRNLLSYVLAADLIGYRTESFDRWLDENLTRRGHSRAGIETLLDSALQDPGNHGDHARASVVAVARFLGDDRMVGRVAARFHDWLGRSSDGFVWRELDWQGDPSRPRGINALGATIEGSNVDGVLPEEQRRSGGFAEPAPHERYVWEGLQGTVATAEMLGRAGFDTWGWEDQALRRAMDWLYDVNEYPAEGDDRWIPWIVNTHYATRYPAESPTRPGKNVGFTDWTHP